MGGRRTGGRRRTAGRTCPGIHPRRHPGSPSFGVVIGVIAVVVMVLVGIGVVISRLSAGEGTPVAGRAAPSVVVVDPEWDDPWGHGKTPWQDKFRDAQEARVGEALTEAVVGLPGAPLGRASILGPCQHVDRGAHDVTIASVGVRLGRVLEPARARAGPRPGRQ